MDDLIRLDATAQAAAVREGNADPRELAEAAIERIEALDPLLNAVVHRRYEAALDGIPAPRSGPFAGVPFLLKDLNADSAGDPAHHGNKALKAAGHRAGSDSWLVGRYRRAGFTILGRTNTPELGLVPVTEPEAYGPSRNPWDTSRSTGGSSGGAAAAVAAGMVPVAHASDGGGSIRIPSSMCGLVGLKPSRGRITAGPTGDESGLSVHHVLTRSVRDTAAVLDATAGPGSGDMAVAPPPAQPFLAALGTPAPPLRIGLLDHNPLGSLHPHNAAAARGAAHLLESLGHHVTDSAPDALGEEESGPRFMIRWAVGARLGIMSLERMLGRTIGPDDVEPLTWALAATSDEVGSAEFALVLQHSSRFSRRLASWWDCHDLLVTPTLGGPPPLLGALTPPPEDPFATQEATASLVPFTTPYNVSGQPAISLPVAVSPDGLPIGIQLVARYGREDLLLQVGASLEEACGWSKRFPVL